MNFSDTKKSKKRIHRIKSLEIPIYHTDIKIILSDDYEYSWDKAVPKGAEWAKIPEETREDLKIRVGFTWYSDHFGMLMIHPNYLTAGLIGHECLHLTSYVMSDISHHLEEGEEPYAYLLEYLIDQSHKAYKGFGFKIK